LEGSFAKWGDALVMEGWSVEEEELNKFTNQ
jgi:hypothetical protein